jgi:hypothetical protein
MACAGEMIHLIFKRFTNSIHKCLKSRFLQGYRHYSVSTNAQTSLTISHLTPTSLTGIVHCKITSLQHAEHIKQKISDLPGIDNQHRIPNHLFLYCFVKKSYYYWMMLVLVDFVVVSLRLLFAVVALNFYHTY